MRCAKHYVATVHARSLQPPAIGKHASLQRRRLSNNCIGDAARQSLNCIKNNKYKMAKNDFQYGRWNSYTLQCGMWLWNRDSKFTKWQHPAVWRWLWDDMPLNSPKRPPYWNSTSGFDFDHITAVDMSFCISLRNFIEIGPPSAEKMTSC